MQRGGMRTAAATVGSVRPLRALPDSCIATRHERLLHSGGCGGSLDPLPCAVCPLATPSPRPRSYQQNPQTIDLVGEENTGRLADTIRLLVQQVTRER